MRPTWGPPGSCRPQMGPCWSHEPCYQGCLKLICIFKMLQRSSNPILYLQPHNPLAAAGWRIISPNWMTLKPKGRHIDNLFVTGCTWGCRNDNLVGSQWREGCQYDDLLVSVDISMLVMASDENFIKLMTYPFRCGLLHWPLNNHTINLVAIPETEMLSFWRHFHHWLYHKLSKWQLPLQSVRNFFVKLTDIRFH